MKNTAKDSQSFCVYIHTNLKNGKKYVGVTSKTPAKRWGHTGTGYKSNKHFWNAIKFYGWNNFSHLVLYKNLDLNQASELEKLFIALYKTNNPDFGYNHTNGGEKQQKFSEETRRKMSIAGKGKIITEEWRKHLSEAGKGHHRGKGKSLSEERKAKLRIASTGKKHSKESIEKMRYNSGSNKPTTVDGIVFDSISFCAEYLGVNPKRLHAWLEGKDSMSEEYKIRGLGFYGVKNKYIPVKSKSKGVYCDGKYFSSMLDCDRFYGFSRMTTARVLSGQLKKTSDAVFLLEKGIRYANNIRYIYSFEY